MASNNIIGLALEISADPSKAIAGIDAVDSRVKKMEGTFAAVNSRQAEMVPNVIKLRQEYAALAEDAAQLEGLPFLSGQEEEGLQIDRELMAQIRTEAAGLGAQLQDDGAASARLMQSMQGALAPLRTFRTLMYSTFGLISFGFYISEWGRVVEAIESGISALEGFDSAAQKAFADMEKGADDALIHFEGLTTAQKIATGYMLIAQTEQRINADAAARSAIQAQSYWHNLSMELQGVIEALGGNPALLASFGSLFGAKSGLASDELQQQNLLIKQMKELQALEKQQREENKKGSHAAIQHAQAIDKLRESMRAFEFQGYLDELRVGSEFSKRQLAEAEKNADATVEYWKKALGLIAAEERWRFQQQTQFYRALGEERKQGLEQMGKSSSAHGRNLRELQLALQHGGSFAGENLSPLGQTYRGFSNSLRQAGEMAGVAIEPVRRLHFEFMQLQQALQVSGVSLGTFSQAMGANIAQSIVYGDNIGRAMEKALKATVSSVAGQALIWSIYSFAMGLWDLFHNPAAAATDFKAAAMFGAVGGAAAAIGAAIPGGGSHGGSAAHAPGGQRGGYGGGYPSGQGLQAAAVGSPMAPGAQGPRYPGGRLTIAIMGEEQAGNWLATTLNRAVEDQGTRLVASHSKTSAPVGQ